MLNARGKVARKGMEFGPSCAYSGGNVELVAQGRLIEGVHVHSGSGVYVVGVSR